MSENFYLKAYRCYAKALFSYEASEVEIEPTRVIGSTHKVSKNLKELEAEGIKIPNQQS